MRLLRLFCLLLTLALAAPGQTTRDLAERHPAAQVVVQFLRHSVNRDFAKAADLIEPGSLGQLKEDYLKRVNNPTLPLDEVRAMCQAVGVEEEKDIAAMTPPAFYVAYSKGLQRRYNVTDEANKKISDTLELNLLSAAEERPDLVHLLVRTNHETLKNKISNLELVSLVKKGNQWLVSLGEQQTKVQPLETTAPATPVAPVAPVAPVTPAPAPAPK